MKVLIAVESNKGLDSRVDSRFGRAAYFLIYDTEKKQILSTHENQFKNEAHGVGIKIGNFVLENGCKAVIGAQAGPKPANILSQAGVKMIVAENVTAKEALETYKTELGT
jgi:predicted Fe-Mo cluster-binding NifX family protein